MALRQAIAMVNPAKGRGFDICDIGAFYIEIVDLRVYTSWIPNWLELS